MRLQRPRVGAEHRQPPGDRGVTRTAYLIASDATTAEDPLQTALESAGGTGRKPDAAAQARTT